MYIFFFVWFDYYIYIFFVVMALVNLLFLLNLVIFTNQPLSGVELDYGLTELPLHWSTCRVHVLPHDEQKRGRTAEPRSIDYDEECGQR
jgi:hypothetical protein